MSEQKRRFFLEIAKAQSIPYIRGMDMSQLTIAAVSSLAADVSKMQAEHPGDYTLALFKPNQPSYDRCHLMLCGTEAPAVRGGTKMEEVVNFDNLVSVLESNRAKYADHWVIAAFEPAESSVNDEGGRSV